MGLRRAGRKARKHNDIINSAHFSRDERLVVTASQDELAKVWDINSGAMVPLQKRTTALFSAEFSPRDDNLVVTGGQDHAVTLWDVHLKNSRVLGMHTAEVRQAAFDREGERVVSASVDGTAKVWDVRNPAQTLLVTLTGHQGALTGAGFSPAGDRVVTASLDGTARVWRPENPPGGYSHEEKLHYLKQMVEKSRLPR